MKFAFAAAPAFALALLSAVSAAQEPAADEAEPDLAQLLNDVNAVADELAENIAGVQDAIADAADSREDGAIVLDRVQISVAAVLAGLAEEGDIWNELGRALAVWDKNRTAALDKSESNPAFDEIAEGWAERIGLAAVLREQILTLRAENMALLNQIVADKELVLAYYDLGRADRALAAMRQVSADLGRMNDSMRAVVDRMTAVAGAAVAQ